MQQVVVVYTFRDMTSGELWIDVTVDSAPFGSLGPFDTAQERQRALDDMMEMGRSIGARELPLTPQ
jgi:hypothetical protein